MVTRDELVDRIENANESGLSGNERDDLVDDISDYNENRQSDSSDPQPEPEPEPDPQPEPEPDPYPDQGLGNQDDLPDAQPEPDPQPEPEPEPETQPEPDAGVVTLSENELSIIDSNDNGSISRNELTTASNQAQESGYENISRDRFVDIVSSFNAGSLLYPNENSDTAQSNDGSNDSMIQSLPVGRKTLLAAGVAVVGLVISQ